MNIWKPLSKISFVSKFFQLKKANKILMDGILRPSSQKQYYSQSPFLYPTFPYNRFYLYELAYASDVLTSVHNSLRRELFRNSYDLVESENKDEETTTSEAETIPKGKTKEEILEFLESINENQQTLIDVLMEIEDDFSIMDNTFMVFMFEYLFDKGELKSRELKEVLRADPRFMGPMINKYDRPAHNDDDVPLYFCPQHRDILLEGRNRCPRCDTKTWLAFYFKDYEGRKLYYSRWEVIFRSKYRPTLRGGYPPVLTCYDDKTEILTDLGWKFFYELGGNEKVATLSDTNKIEYQKPISHQILEFKGKLYKINTNKIDLAITSDHSIYAAKDNGGYKEKYGFYQPSEIDGKRFKFLKAGKWLGEDKVNIQEFTLPSIIKHYKKTFGGDIDKICPEIKINMDVWLEFMGYFLSEGSTSRNQTVRIAQSKDVNPEKYDKIKKCLQKLPFKFSEIDMGFAIHFSQLAIYLSKFGKCHDKYIERSLLDLPPNKLKILFDALMVGDGSGDRYATTSKKLADDFQELCFKIGWSADIYHYNEIYIISVRNQGVRNTSETTINKFRKDDYWEDYDGLVYDVTVEKYHTLYVRRNGKCCWSGNCWQKTRTLLFMDKYVMELYDGQRPPKSGLFFKTSNQAGLEKAIDEAKLKVNENPHWPLILGVPNNTNGQSFVQFIDFMRSLSDLQNTEMRNEYRRQLGCYDNHTEILTNEGWKYFNQLTKNEEVAQFNMQTKHISWVKPTNYFSKHYEGEMINFKRKGINLLVTPNHNMVMCSEKEFFKGEGNYKLKRADKLNRFIFPKAGYWNGNRIDKFVLPDLWIDDRHHILKKEIDGDVFAEFMGIWMAEGSASKWHNNYKIQIAQSKEKNPEKYQQIADLLDYMPFNYFKRDCGFVINSKQLYEYLHQFGHSGDKFVPDIIKNASSDQITRFIDWFVMGDGDRRSYGSIGSSTRLSSKSELLVDDIQEMLLKINTSSHKYTHPQGHFELWTHFRKNGEDKNFKTIRKENIHKKNYSGMIYCVEVPEHAVIVRRFGDIAICGNSIYGVEPIFQGDVSTGGGLNNEGLQVTVTNRAIEYGQGIYNNNFFPKILKAMGTEGWTLTLNPSEEQDEMAKLTRQNQSLFNGQIAIGLGLEAEYDDDTGEVIIKPGKLEEKEVPESPFGAPTTPPRATGAPSIGKGFEFNKELIKARTRPPFTKLSNILKNEIDNFIKRFKRKPSEAELSKTINKINLKLTKELETSSKRLFKQTYLTEMGKVEKELGSNVLFNTVDENALSVLANQDVLLKAYTGITSNLTNELNGIIQEAYRDPKGLTTKQITDKIKDLTDVADFRAETIARTETGKISSAARKTSYSKEEGFDTFLFKWVGPNDNRTTDTSKRIKARTKGGVPWSELIKIVEEESSVDFPEWTVNKEFPVSHYQSRHTFIKIPGTTTKSKEEAIRKEFQEIEDKRLEAEKKQADEELDLEIKKKELKVLKDKEELINNLKNG